MDDWKPVIAIIAMLMGGQTFVNNKLDTNRADDVQSNLQIKVERLEKAINSQDEDLFKLFIQNQSRLLTALEDLTSMEVMKGDAIQEFLTELRYLAEGRERNRIGDKYRLGSE